jgi:signal transduction histidine kinase
MEAWLIGMKFLLLAYVVISYALAGGGSGATVVLIALTFVCMSMLPHLLRPRVLRRILRVFSAALPAAAFILVDPGFVVLFPLASVELVYDLSGSLLWSVLPPILIAGLIPREIVAPYILAAGLGILAFVLASQSSARLEALRRENERLRASNEDLQRSAVRSAEYESELSYLSQLEERNRLAQDIHDRVGHAIAGGIIQLEGASALLDRDREGARAMIGNSIHALRDGMESIRAAVRGIKPAREELGVHRIKTMLDRFAAGGEIGVRFTHAGDLDAIAHTQWKLIMDNVRECLTNTIRHSSARNLRVGVEVLNRIVKVEVRDDGRGVYSIRKGLGLSGIEERTSGIGGKVIFDGSKGFSVIMLLPRESTDAH